MFLELSDAGIELQGDVGLDMRRTVLSFLQLSVNVGAEGSPLFQVVARVEVRIVVSD